MEWAENYWNQLMGGIRQLVPQAVDETTGEVVPARLVEIPPNRAAARQHAQIEEALYRQYGVTPPWAEEYHVGQAGAQPRQVVSDEDKPLTRREVERLMKEQGRVMFAQGETFEAAMQAIPQQLAVPPAFFTEKIVWQREDGTQENKSRLDVIERYCALNEAEPTVALAWQLFGPDLNAALVRKAYTEGVAQFRADQSGLSTPGMARSSPFPEVPANDAVANAYEQVSQTPHQHFSTKPGDGQARTVAVSGARRY